MPLLILYSHGRNPPLHPPPDLRYDLRGLPNPPKALRDVSDGRSKRLREHLLADPKFLARLKSVEEDITATMQTKLAEHETQLKESGMQRNEEEEQGDLVQIEQAGTRDDGIVGDASSNDIALRVGCNCALGHHRSVAFVCELASRSWPGNWEVNVIHRDLEKKRSGGARERQKAASRKKMPFFEAQSED